MPLTEVHEGACCHANLREIFRAHWYLAAWFKAPSLNVAMFHKVGVPKYQDSYGTSSTTKKTPTVIFHSHLHASFLNVVLHEVVPGLGFQCLPGCSKYMDT